MNYQSSTDELIKAVYEYTANLAKNGISREEVKSDLISKGLDAQVANVVVNNIFELFLEAAKRNMLYGSLWCIGGIVVTVLTY